jgi:hypothetical protein
MFNNRLFRTTPELDFLRGPLLTAYLRFEILIWALIAGLSLLALLANVFLPTSQETSAINAASTLLGLLGFSVLVLLMFIAVWRFKKWGVYVLALWTLVMAVGLVVAVFQPARDWLFVLALLGWLLARGLVLIFEIRPKWPYFAGGWW